MPKDDADGFGGLLLRARPRFSSEAMVPGTTATSLLGLGRRIQDLFLRQKTPRRRAREGAPTSSLRGPRNISLGLPGMEPAVHFDGGECAAEDEDFVAKAQRRRSRTVMNMGEAAMLRAAPVGVPMVGVPEAEAAEAEALARAEAEAEAAALSAKLEEVLDGGMPVPAAAMALEACLMEEGCDVEAKASQLREADLIL